jgi:hypothetical protein
LDFVRLQQTDAASVFWTFVREIIWHFSLQELPRCRAKIHYQGLYSCC